MDRNLIVLLTITSLINSCYTQHTKVINGNVYYFSYPMTKNWYQALRYCLHQNMDLLDIRSSAEQATIESVLNSTHYVNNDVRWWIGGTDLGSEANFYWSTGQEMFYDNFNTNRIHDVQPDNFAGIEHCVEIFPDGYWNDYICEWPLPFICREKVSGC